MLLQLFQVMILCSSAQTLKNNIEKSLMIFFTLIESEVELVLQSETQLNVIRWFV